MARSLFFISKESDNFVYFTHWQGWKLRLMLLFNNLMNFNGSLNQIVITGPTRDLLLNINPWRPKQLEVWLSLSVNLLQASRLV